MPGNGTCPACGEWHIGTGELCPRAVAGTWEFNTMIDSKLFTSVPPGSDLTKDELAQVLAAYLRDPVFARRFADCMEMIRKKNADYTQGTEKRDRIGAFRRIGADIDVPMTKVWAIFAQKHWGAVMKFVKDGQVESEPIDSRINDLINYFVLLGAIIHDGEDE